MSKRRQLTLNEDLLRESGIPERYWTLDPGTYWADPLALDLTERFTRRAISGNRQSLFLHGPSFSCKTFLATYALRCLAANNCDIAYRTVDALTSMYFDQSAQFNQFVADSMFLAVDNIAIPEKGGTPLVLDQIIKARKDLDLPLILVSCLTVKEMQDLYREATVSFINNRAVCIAVTSDPVRRDAYLRQSNSRVDRPND